MNPKITIFTPTLNRAYIISNLYISLCNQEYKNFEWIIIDQGNDETEELVNRYKEDNIVKNIIYVKSIGRRGINRAFNDAIPLAKGVLFMKVDDDDYLSTDALRLVNDWENNLRNKEMYAGVAGLRGYHDGSVIGDVWAHKSDFVDATNTQRDSMKLRGDKAEAYYTSVLQQYGFFPEFEGESYTDEGIVYNRIALKGLKIRWYNKVIYYTEYLDDGMTKNNETRMKESPKMWKFILNEVLKYPNVSIISKIKRLCRFFEFCRSRGETKQNVVVGFDSHVVVINLCWYLSCLTKFVR